MRSIESVVAAGLCHRGQVADRLRTATRVVTGSPCHAAFERRTGEQVITQFLPITSRPIPDLCKQELATGRDHRTGLGKHHHRGTVTAVNTKDQWEYFEGDCDARPGVYVRATPDTIHTLHVFLLAARATYAEFGSLVADLRQPVSVFDVQTRA